MMKYVVQKGDTLYGISRQFGISVEDLMSENQLTTMNLSVGMSLIIPSYGTISDYIVQKGDTLYSISQKYNISVSELMLLNNLTTNSLKIGQVLNVPVGDTVDDFNYYEVLPGDTLYSIAKKYDTTVDSLITLNQLNNSTLSVGQVLKVPSTSIDALEDEYYYVVQKGDTLYSIAKKAGISVSDLIEINSLTSSNLFVGQKLFLTKKDEVGVGSSCYGDNYQEIEYVTYTVKKGDNLYNIAKKYGVSVPSILKLNNLISNNLSIGQVLKIKEV